MPNFPIRTTSKLVDLKLIEQEIIKLLTLVRSMQMPKDIADIPEHYRQMSSRTD